MAKRIKRFANEVGMRKSVLTQRNMLLKNEKNEVLIVDSKQSQS